LGTQLGDKYQSSSSSSMTAKLDCWYPVLELGDTAWQLAANQSSSWVSQLDDWVQIVDTGTYRYT
ncbi:hypothetical protein PCASD_23517, partial [Puccinia coronata f. sp. avenae]